MFIATDIAELSHDNLSEESLYHVSTGTREYSALVTFAPGCTSHDANSHVLSARIKLCCFLSTIQNHLHCPSRLPKDISTQLNAFPIWSICWCIWVAETGMGNKGGPVGPGVIPHPNIHFISLHVARIIPPAACLVGMKCKKFSAQCSSLTVRSNSQARKPQLLTAAVNVTSRLHHRKAVQDSCRIPNMKRVAAATCLTSPNFLEDHC